MKYRALGKSGINASVVAYGAWAIGGWMWGGTNEKEAIDGIHAALDAGINFIDTAPVYGFGISEQIVGKAVRGKRDKIIIATKCGLVWDTKKGNFYFTTDADSIKSSEGSINVYRYLGRESIRKEIESSLKRLGTDYIDLYQTHWQESTTPIEDTMDELCKLRAEGKIRAIGCCNANIDQMKKYSLIGVLDTDQEKYSMLDRGLEAANLKYCSDNGIAFLAYSPMANGLLTGKITAEREFSSGDLRYANPRFSVENRNRVIKSIGKLDGLKEKYNATYSQLVLAWTFHQKGCSHVLAGSRNSDQAIDNAKSGDIEFTNDDIEIFKAVTSELKGI